MQLLGKMGGMLGDIIPDTVKKAFPAGDLQSAILNKTDWPEAVKKFLGMPTKAELEQHKLELRAEMERRLEAMRTQLHEEEKEKLLKLTEEKREQQKNEMRMLGDELQRAAEQLKELRERVGEMSAELEEA